MMSQYLHADKMFTFVRGFAMGRKCENTISALNYARRLHSSQTRKSGEPYIVHPLAMVCHAISIGIDDDTVLAALLLHDVVEDCGVALRDLPVDQETKEIVLLVTFTKPDGVDKEAAKKLYYGDIEKNVKASLVKIIDRCNNVSTMSGVFAKPKLEEYIKETEDYVLPLIQHTKEYFPEYSNMLWLLKYHIVSVLEALKGMQSYAN